MNEKNLKGLAAEHLVIYDAMENGLSVEKPLDTSSIHDLTVGGIRFQVKRAKRRGRDMDRVALEPRRPSAKDRTYHRSQIDAFAIVDPVTRKVAYIHIAELSVGRQQTLFMTRNHSKQGYGPDYTPIYFEDFTDINRIFEISA